MLKITVGLLMTDTVEIWKMMADTHNVRYWKETERLIHSVCIESFIVL